MGLFLFCTRVRGKDTPRQVQRGQNNYTERLGFTLR
jgi:hypothetical protein